MTKQIKILVYPKDANPYQDLLYDSMPETAQIHYLQLISRFLVIKLLLFFPQLLFYRLKGYKVFHLHWLYFLTFSHKISLIDTIFKRFAIAYCFIWALYIKLLGYKFVWTIHNVVPHEKHTANDELITRILCNIANEKIVHSADTLHQLEKINADIKNTHIVPMGSYVGLYPNNTTKKEAQERLHIDPQKTTFLFFGLIRKYKGVEQLLEVFQRVHKKFPATQLIIAGSCNNAGLKKLIIKAQQENNTSIFTILHRIPSNEVQYYFSAADIAIFPFKKVTTSSSVVLALSFGKPVVYPKIGNMKDLPDPIGYSYDPTDIEGLEKAIELSLISKKDRKLKSIQSQEYANTLSWNKVAEKTYNQIYKE